MSDLLKVEASVRYTAPNNINESAGQRYRQVFQLGSSLTYAGYIVSDELHRCEDKTCQAEILFEAMGVYEYNQYYNVLLGCGAVLPILRGKEVIGEAVITKIISVA